MSLQIKPGKAAINQYLRLISGLPDADCILNRPAGHPAIRLSGCPPMAARNLRDKYFRERMRAVLSNSVFFFILVDLLTIVTGLLFVARQ